MAETSVDTNPEVSNTAASIHYPKSYLYGPHEYQLPEPLLGRGSGELHFGATAALFCPRKFSAQPLRSERIVFVGARYKHVRIHKDTALAIYPLGPQAHSLRAVHTGWQVLRARSRSIPKSDTFLYQLISRYVFLLSKVPLLQYR